MKHVLSFFLALSLLLTAGCGQDAPDPAPPKADAPAPIVSTQPEENGSGPSDSSEDETADSDQPDDGEPEEPYVRVIDPSLPMVALTFDDGPHPEYTDQILDVLEKHHAVATFFEVGRNVRNCPDPLPRMAELGCEIASHSNAHKDLSKLKKSAMLQDLDTADQAFLDAGVDAPTLVRPPYGAVNKAVKYDSGRAMITWTVDTLDWKVQDTEQVVSYVQGLTSLDGEIVLLHSIYQTTADAVAELIPWLIEQGYQLVTVSELMAYYYGELPAPGSFYGYTYFTTHGRTDAPLQLPLPQEEITEGEGSGADGGISVGEEPLQAVEPSQAGSEEPIQGEEPPQKQ